MRVFKKKASAMIQTSSFVKWSIRRIADIFLFSDLHFENMSSCLPPTNNIFFDVSELPGTK